MLKLAEAYMQRQREEHPEYYFDELPSLCQHLLEMVVSERYVFSADFLARGYRFDRLSAEKMWRMTCVPEQTTFQDVSSAVFTGNPECLNVPEAQGIWTSQPVNETQAFPFGTDLSRQQYQTQKRKNENRSPQVHEVETVPMNLQEMNERLESLRITREDRENLKNSEFGSEDDSDDSLSL